MLPRYKLILFKIIYNDKKVSEPSFIFEKNGLKLQSIGKLTL